MEHRNNMLDKLIPPQYKGIPAEALETIRTTPLYIDEQKTREEQEKKSLAIKLLKAQEQQQQIQKVQELKAQLERGNQQLYSTFIIKHGETDIGKIRYQYENLKAKELKKLGAFKTGEERLYFDIQLDQADMLKDIIKEVVISEHIPISFKFLDQESSTIDAPDTETFFVANFINKSDAKRFYNKLKTHPKYTYLQGGKKHFGGSKIDAITHYSTGYKESRFALENIAKNAKQNTDGTRSYIGMHGAPRTITNQEYQNFLKAYQDLQEKLRR